MDTCRKAVALSLRSPPNAHSGSAVRYVEPASRVASSALAMVMLQKAGVDNKSIWSAGIFELFWRWAPLCTCDLGMSGGWRGHPAQVSISNGHDATNLYTIVRVTYPTDFAVAPWTNQSLSRHYCMRSVPPPQNTQVPQPLLIQATHRCSVSGADAVGCPCGGTMDSVATFPTRSSTSREPFVGAPPPGARGKWIGPEIISPRDISRPTPGGKFTVYAAGHSSWREASTA